MRGKIYVLLLKVLLNSPNPSQPILNVGVDTMGDTNGPDIEQTYRN